MFFHDKSAPLSQSQSQVLLNVTIGSAFAFAGLLIMWLVWFLTAICVTRRALKSLPYASHRFQQLCYRFFLFQKLAIVAFVVILDTIPIVSFLSTYIADYKCVEFVGVG